MSPLCLAQDSPLILQSDRNVTVNARNGEGQLTGQLTIGSEMVVAQCQRFEVRSADGERVLFSADEEEISIGTEKLRVTGNEGVVFSHSVETSHVRAEPFQDLKLESPTRTLTLEAPRGVEINAGVGDFTASCRKDLLLQSSDGEILLDATTIRLGSIPLGSAVDPLEGAPAGTTYTKQTVYELCSCANGKLYLSPAEKGLPNLEHTARPTPLRDPGAHNFNPGAGWSSLPGQLADPFPYRAELDLPVPQRRNCSPTPTKKEHRGPSRLKPPLGFPGTDPRPLLPCVGKTGVCVRPLSVREED
uniref:Uncharacterized protein n=1 Tax=Knipowitschia caucasica TaxID=637954 RepID=A0AAV2LKL8_KNICA